VTTTLKIWLLILAALSGIHSLGQAETCPEWIQNSANFPPCPPSGSALLDETYPLVGMVVSDQTQSDSGGNEFTSDFVEKVLKASGDRPPILLLPVSETTFTKVAARIAQTAKNEKQKNQWLQSIRKVPMRSFTWQQDYFESFTSLKGEVILRSVNNYRKEENLVPPDATLKLAESAGTCGFKVGKPLQTKDAEPVAGAFGGNIESLPGGICMVGDDHFESEKDWSNYVRQFCGLKSIGLVEKALFLARIKSDLNI
jgi:hypothetical protein